MNYPTDVEPCPHCGTISGIKVLTNTPPKVWAWSCGDCGTDWAVTVVNPYLRPWLDQLAEDMAALVVLREVAALAERADTLTDGQLLAWLIGCLTRLDQICRCSEASKFPAGHRPNNEVPSVQPVPRIAR